MVKVNPKRTLKSLFSREEVDLLYNLDADSRMEIIQARIKSREKRERAEADIQLMREFIHSDARLVRDFENFKAMAKLSNATV